MSRTTEAEGTIERPQRGPFWQTLNERLALSSLAYPVPDHANSLSYLLGGITLGGFIILILTGIILAQFYNPDPAAAHQSIVYMVTRASLVDFVRSLHFWTANLVVVSLLLHLGRVFATGSYKRPREINWLVGVALLAVTLGFVFTGTVLKWDQEAVEALAHNREIGDLLGIWGVWFTSEFTLSVPILTRLYLGHVTLLPAAFTVLIGVHLFLVKQLGISPKPGAEATSGPPTTDQGGSHFGLHVRKMVGFGLLLLAVAGGLALIFPAELGQPGIVGAEVTKPAWMFLPIYPLEDVFGIRGLLISTIVLLGLLASVPFIDRSPWLSPQRRRWIIAAGALGLAVAVGLGAYAWFSRPVAHLMGG